MQKWNCSRKTNIGKYLALLLSLLEDRAGFDSQIPYHPAWCLVSRPSQFFPSLFRQRRVITHLLPFTGQGRQLRALWLKHAWSREQYQLRNTTNSNQSETHQRWSAIPRSQKLPLPTASHCRDGFRLRPLPRSPKSQHCYNLSYLLPEC